MRGTEIPMKESVEVNVEQMAALVKLWCIGLEIHNSQFNQVTI